ncbi:MAG: molybdate ABC transporter substrate-binding protein [Pseudomonadota bacterium]
MSRLICVAAMGIVLLSPSYARADGVTVFAAASLKTALDEIAGMFEAETGHGVTLSYAGSSVLARQIQHGAPADVFISASSDWMDVLEADGLIEPKTRVDLLGNRLMLIVHGRNASPAMLHGRVDDWLGEEGRIAMALVDAVPAGIYGKAALESLGLWDRVADRVVQADNVRAALALVATGEAPLGIVYLTDALVEDRVSPVVLVDPTAHPPIVYPVARIAESDGPMALPFLAFLQGPEARAVFERHGFRVLVE